MKANNLADSIHFFRLRGYREPLIDTRHIASDIPQGRFRLTGYDGRAFLHAPNQWEYLADLIPRAQPLNPSDLGWWDQMFDRSTWLQGHALQSEMAKILKPAYPHLLTPVEAAGCTYGASMVYRLKAMKGPLGELFKLATPDMIEQLIGVLMPYLLSNAGFYPEVFGKGSFTEFGHIVAPGQALKIRHDSTMALTEPEFALGFNARGALCMLYLLDDHSESMLEKLCALYLHLSKTGLGSGFISPMAVLRNPVPLDTEGDVLPKDMTMEIIIADASGKTVLQGSYQWGQMSRAWNDIGFHALANRHIGHGLILSTGTGWAHDDTKPLQPGWTVSMRSQQVFPDKWFTTPVRRNKLQIPIPEIVRQNMAAMRNVLTDPNTFRLNAEAAAAGTK